MKKQVYLFEYNVPAENHSEGRTDLYISCQAEWFGTYYDTSKRPVIINNSPIFSRLSNLELYFVKDWYILIRDIEEIAQDHFIDLNKPKHAVDLAEQTLN